MKKNYSLLLLVIGLLLFNTGIAQTPIAGKLYKIKNVSASAGGTDLFIGSPTDAYARISSTGIGDVFFVGGSTTSSFNLLQINTGKYLYRDGGWDGKFKADYTDVNATFNFVVESDNTISITCLANNAKVGADAISDGSQIYLNKGVGNNGKWVFVEQSPAVGDLDLMKTYLQTEIDATQATEGSFGTEETAALAAMETSVANIASWDDMGTLFLNVHTAISNYMTSMKNPFTGYSFNLKHYNSEFYVSKSTTASFTNARIQTFGTDGCDQVFEFEEIPTIPNGVRMKTADGYYLNHSGYTSSWTTTPGTGSNMIVEKDASGGFIKLKFASDSKYFGTDGNTNGSGIYTDKNGASNNHRWIIEILDSRVSLRSLIDDVTLKLTNAVIGTEIGNYPQTVIDALQAAIDVAQLVYDNENATDEDIDIAKKDLQTALDWFTSQQISFSTPYIGKPFWVVHSSGLLLSKIDYDLYAKIQDVNKPEAVQEFEFESVIGQVDVVALKSNDGKFLSFDGWNTPWIDSINTATHMKISATDDGYLRLKFVNKNYIGTDAFTDSAAVWADKSGNDINHKWMVQTPGTVVKIKLRGATVKSDTLLTHITKGNGLFQFPTDDYNVFINILNASKTVLNKEVVTQSEIDNQTVTLNDALNDLYLKQILPVLSPESSSRYLITNKKYTGYVNHNGNRALLENTVPLEGWEFVGVRDSVFVIKQGDLAIAQSLNMVNYSLSSVDQHWYAHYDGPKAYEVFVPDTMHYFSFTKDNVSNAMQITSLGRLQLTTDHSHSDQSQWFKIEKVGTPIITVFSALITKVEGVLSSTAVGTAYGQYPQTAKDSLTSALAKAQIVLDNSSELTQAQINEAAKNLEESLNWYYNQKIVWKPDAKTAYLIGNRDNTNYLSIDTLDANDAKGFKLDSIPFVNQLWFFKPVPNKAGFYHIVSGKRSIGTSGGTEVFVQNYDVETASELEVVYLNTTSGIDYFRLTSSNTYPNIHIDSDGNIATDRFTYNNYQMKLVPAGALRTEVLLAVQLRDSASIGNGIGQYTQESSDIFTTVINSSIDVVMNTTSTEEEMNLKLVELIAAQQTFREGQNGYGLDLGALLVAIEIAEDLLENTIEIGDDPGKCPQALVDDLTDAITVSRDASGGLDQMKIDEKVTVLTAAIETFELGLKTSTGLPELLIASNEQYDEAVEGTGAGEYAEGSKEIFKTAIDAAQEVLNKKPVLQAELATAYSALNDARDAFNLGRVPNLDTADLEEIIGIVVEFLSDKSEAEFTGLRAKLKEAQELLASPTKTQEEIDSMTEELALLLESTGVDDVLGDSIKIYSSGGNIFVRGLNEEVCISIYTINGQILSLDQVRGTDYSKTISEGVYLVTVRNNYAMKKSIIIVRF